MSSQRIVIASTNGLRGLKGDTGPAGGVAAVVAGANVTVDNTDPTHPVVASTGGGGGGGVDTATIHAATSKVTPVDADETMLLDSAASFGLKRLTWANLKAAIASYIASVTQTVTNKDLSSGTNTFPTFNQSTTGNAATATKLLTARTINGVAFDGTANISLGTTSVTAAGITDSGTTGRALVQAATTTDAKTTLGLLDTDINTKVASYNSANPVFISIGSDEADPTPVNGKLLLRLSAPAAATKAVAEVGEFMSPSTAASFTFTPPSTATTDTVYMLALAGQTSTNATAGRFAGFPSTITGGGRTWSLVSGTQILNSANSQTSAAIYKGVYLSGATTQDIVITMAAAATGGAPSTSHDRIGARLVALTGFAGTVVQSVTQQNSLATVTASLSGVNSANAVLGFITANSGSNALTLNSTPAFTELTPQQSNASPAIRTGSAYAFPGSGSLSWTAAASNAANKLQHLIEVS